MHPAMVAFTARFYFRDARKSYTQVYVCDLNGKHRNQISHGPHECDRVRWIGKHSIAYIVDGQQVRVLNLNTGRSRQVLRTETEFDLIESAPVRRNRGTSPLPHYEARGKSYAVNARRAKEATPPEPYYHRRLPITTELGVVEWAEPDNLVLRIRSSDIPLGNDYGDGTGGFVDAWVSRHKLFFVRYNTLSTWGEYYQLLTLDKAKTTELATGHELDVDTSRRWIGWVDHRNLPHKRGVPNYWIAGAGVKDWQTGKKVVLVDGLAYATSIGISPAAP